MQTIIRKLFNENGKEIGSILTVMAGKITTLKEKTEMESHLIDYSFSLYAPEPIGIYSEIHSDLPSIVVLKGVNDLPYNEIEIL